MNTLDKQYKDLLRTILEYGATKKDRTGTGTKSIFGYTIRHNMQEGFPLLTTKKMAWKQIVTELLWFLRGDTNIKFLHENDCHIWDGDYKKSGRDDGELGPIYGKQWRDWGGIDQIDYIIREINNTPDSRRLMVNAWNVSDLDKMTLPPCHYGFQLYTRDLNLDERIDYFNTHSKALNKSLDYHHIHMDSLRVPKKGISLLWNQRSVDTFLGLPFNIASYGLLLEIIAKEVKMIPLQLIGNLGDVHLYKNHIEQAKEQLSRNSFPLPSLCLDYRDGEYNKNLKEFVVEDFQLFGYKSHKTIKAVLSN